MNIAVFVNVTPCILVETDKYFERKHCHYHHNSQKALHFPKASVTFYPTLKPSILKTEYP